MRSVVFHVKAYKVRRVAIPFATLHFTGCNPDRTHEHMACFNISRGTPATVNGSEVYGHIHLFHGRHFVRWIDRAMGLKWDARYSHIARVPTPGQYMPPDSTRAQRKAIIEFAEAWAARVGDEDVILAAEAARLAAQGKP